LFFLAVLAIGLTLLGIVWLLSALVSRATRGRRRAVGFEVRERAATRRDGGSQGTDAERPVVARRSQRH
jgi:hypothetical protein